MIVKWYVPKSNIKMIYSFIIKKDAEERTQDDIGY